jgi:hypothetical protein
LAFVLTAIYQVKHFVADFPLQREYMLRKVRPGWDFAPPLLLHCTVHAAMTLVIISFFSWNLWWLVLVDLGVHFVMDRIKAGPKYLGRYNDKNRSAFWNCLGFDQMVHHLTHLYIVWVIVNTVA